MDAAAALSQLEAAVAAVQAVDWDGEAASSAGAAAVELQRLGNRLAAGQLAAIAAVGRRQVFRADGAVTSASWLGARANLDAAAATRLCTTAWRLADLPVLAQALADGDVSLAHVVAVTEAAVPQRRDAVVACEQALTDLARTAPPRQVRVAVARIRDLADRDGTEPPEVERPFTAGPDDPRLYWRQYPTVDGMVEGGFCVDAGLAEMLNALYDAYSTPDPPGTPLTSRTTPGQRRVAAMRAAVTALLASGAAPTVQGVKPHLLMMLDLLTVMGRDQAATFAAELARTGRVSASTIARLGLTMDARVTTVLTIGRWRPVAVADTQRTLPGWLRPLLLMIHRRCRGPDCDRPASWTQAHHEVAYADGGPTDVNNTIPLCPAHHNLVTYHGWTVTVDRDTGIATWNGPHGQTTHVHPQP
ncbi:MAG TPA: hypothetical protein VM307_06450 [Egibacteraceae bacterium]|nr:hypothetical protein [Egibacteraceae bacterium]